MTCNRCQGLLGHEMIYDSLQGMATHQLRCINCGNIEYVDFENEMMVPFIPERKTS